MNSLVKIQNNQAVTSSRMVAKVFDKSHKHVLDSIDNIIQKHPALSALYRETSYIHPQNKQRYRQYEMGKEGLKTYIDNCRKEPDLQPLIQYYNDKYGRELEPIVLVSRFEDSFISKLQDTLQPLGIDIETQKIVLNYKLDTYIPSLNIAIEYDESQHTYTIEEDRKREQDIKNFLNCTFIRCDYQDTDSYNIGLVFKEILRKAGMQSE